MLNHICTAQCGHGLFDLFHLTVDLSGASIPTEAGSPSTDGNGTLRAIYAPLIGIFLSLTSTVVHAGPHTDRTPRAREIECLALTIYHESRGLPPRGREAVAHVVLNRAQLNNRSICNVVYERRGNSPQFSWTVHRNTRPREQQAWIDAQSMARNIMNNRPYDITYGATHFYNPRIANPAWARNRNRILIHNHMFVRIVETRN